MDKILTSLHFRKAVVNDVELIASLAKKIWYSYYPSIISVEQIDFMLEKMYSKNSLIKQMEDGCEFTIVYSEKNPLGYLSLSSENNKNYFIHKFYIEIGWHNQGLGSSFFSYILNDKFNASSFELMVNRENYKAINFYFKHGFVIKESVNIDIGGGFFMNDFLMIKKIKS